MPWPPTRLGALNRIPGVINTVLVYHFGGDDIGDRPIG